MSTQYQDNTDGRLDTAGARSALNPTPPQSAPTSTIPTALTTLITSLSPSSSLHFHLNGRSITLSNPNPHWTLLDFIRAQPSLKGTKLGCGEGGCGACTVVLQVQRRENREDARTRGGRKVKHVAVNACLFPLVGVDGKHVITVEGLGNAEKPHPLQERIAKMHGSQCGFCTPGIVMSLYALVRNAWDGEEGVFRLSERDVEMEGCLDGNLCRCTGYKPILQAAKTFITEDLEGRLVSESDEDEKGMDGVEGGGGSGDDCVDVAASKGTSCGRPGGCCRDSSPSKSSDDATPSEGTQSTEPTSPDSDSASVQVSTTSNLHVDPVSEPASVAKPLKSKENASADAQVEEKTVATSDVPLTSSADKIPQFEFAPYSPTTELIFPPRLRRHAEELLCFQDERRMWLRPVTEQSLLEIMKACPDAKIVSGASETQVETRFKSSEFPVCVYVADITDLNATFLPETEAEIHAMKELTIAANTPLTELEDICKRVCKTLGRRASAIEALRKQLRFFAGRQIRNVATLAGNLATASPISDANPVLLAAGAELHFHHLNGTAISTSRMAVREFFTGYRKTAMEKLPPGSIISSISIPIPPPHIREITKAYKQAKRKDDDIAIVTSGFRIVLSAENTVEDAMLAFGGMGPMTAKAELTNAFLMDKTWFSEDTLSGAMRKLMEDFDLSFGVIGGMAQYRRCLAASMFFRFWHEVVAEFQLGEVPRGIIDEIERDISTGTRDNYNPYEQRVVGKQIPHLSSLRQCTGEAEYVDDIPPQNQELFGGLVLSARAHAKIISIDWEPALMCPGVVSYIDKHSLPKELNIWGSIKKDEPFFADGLVESHGQIIGMVYADSAIEAQRAARAVVIVYEDLPAILTIDEAIAANSFFPHPKMLKKGAAVHTPMEYTFAKCDRVFEGVFRLGGQEHFYLETNAALVIPLEDGAMDVWSSTQNTMETQEFVSSVTGVPSNRINAKVKRMGGAFGGKESRSVPIACLLAIAAKKEKRPMRIMLNRDEDMMTTGQRHPMKIKWKMGVKSDGKLVALDADLYDNAGFSHDMSGAVMDRALTHIDNCYEIPHVFVRGHVCKTNTHSNTAFRGFGGPQAMYFTECIMSTIAEGLNIDIDDLRILNLYKETGRTPFLQQIDQDWHIPIMIEQLKQSSDYEARKKAVATFNSTHAYKKRGISLIPTKFGLSFATALHLNQASARVQLFRDGSVLLHHGGTEMGQGLYTKMVQVAAQELGVPVSQIFTQDSSSYQTANASPTAASSGSDLNGMAVRNACAQLVEDVIIPYREKLGPQADLKTIAAAAYMARENLTAMGFWKMPRIGYEWGNYDEGTQKPMYYYWTQGVGVSEVEVDCLTGDHTVLRTDLLMDVGQSINPAIDYGQVEGAFIQGQGLFTTEESLWSPSSIPLPSTSDSTSISTFHSTSTTSPSPKSSSPPSTSPHGTLLTRGPSTYKIPSFASIPQIFNTSFLRTDLSGNPISWKELRSVQSSKGVGEPPLFLGATVWFALREAVRSAWVGNRGGGGDGDNGGKELGEWKGLECPATCERLRQAVGDGIWNLARVTREKGEGERGWMVRAQE
ncbi:hypothetical protein K402DRAFT_466465 [Aulographum hederae CBS 113979]|uniref:Xanthine dehydrogenase n=1 Tax=Aulographum hederae CBS 113979 TaxID=1176131 RepID=A0A6G1GPV1_9PEZI|nr:hypothetical protein K402DRAFT_466465 [Aulographum hederae CBS 113979]